MAPVGVRACAGWLGNPVLLQAFSPEANAGTRICVVRSMSNELLRTLGCGPL